MPAVKTLATIIGLMLIAGAAVAPFIVDRERRPLDVDARAGVSGEYVSLGDGLVRYEFSGPEDGPPVVLVHGFSVGYFCWDHTVGALADAGFRVLRFDLYGHGYSDRPNVEYTVDLFDRQLLELTEALDVSQPFALAGWSMGGMIAGAFCDRYPDRVSKLVLIDPAGYPLDVPPVIQLTRLPGVGEYLMKLAGDWAILQNLPLSFHEPDRYPEFFDAYRAQMTYRGFKRAVLSALRNMPFETFAATYRRVGEQDRPVMLLWGEEDAVTPFANHAALLEDVPNAAFHAIEQAGHTPHYERPDVVNALLIEFLHDGSPGGGNAHE